MEWFVRLITSGGIALVVGLWIMTLLEAWSLPWLLGTTLVLLGIAGLGGGIWLQIDY